LRNFVSIVLLSLFQCGLLASCAAPTTETTALTASIDKTTSGARPTEFTFNPTANAPIKVFMQLPAAIDSRTEIVFALHGMGRGADATFGAWQEAVGSRNFIIVAPLFAESDYPSSNYAEGNTISKSLTLNPTMLWTFNIIEELFDHVRKASGVTATGYLLYGHSAGGQFTHRMIMLMPQGARMKHAYAANSGWYMMPDNRANYPYGLEGAPPNAMTSCLGYSRPMTLLLGEADTDSNHYQLRRTKQAMRQGTNRFERGKTFFDMAKRDAAARGCPFNWRAHTVPDAAHEQAKMAAATVALLNP
jgi:pimeloyl-ACP methyl ester carboxylesterase